MHLLGTSVLMLVVLPLGFSNKSGNINNKVAEDYRNVIEPRLKHVRARIDQLNSNCTSKKFKEPENAGFIPRKICKLNRQLRRFGEQSEIITRLSIPGLPLLVEEINFSLSCRCHNETKKANPKNWKVCKVKHILATLQTHFEEYNALQSINTESPKRGRTLQEQTDAWPASIS